MVIISRDAAIPYLTAVVTAPLTTTVRGIRSEVPLGSEEGLRKESVATCDSLWTVVKEALDPQPVGSLGVIRLIELDRALRYALDIRY